MPSHCCGLRKQVPAKKVEALFLRKVDAGINAEYRNMIEESS